MAEHRIHGEHGGCDLGEGGGVCRTLARRRRADRGHPQPSGGRVVLVGLHVGLDELGRHQLDGVPEQLELARSVVRTTTGLHADQARGQIGKKLRHLGGFELLLQRGLAVLVDPMHLNNGGRSILASIDISHFLPMK